MQVTIVYTPLPSYWWNSSHWIYTYQPVTPLYWCVSKLKAGGSKSYWWQPVITSHSVIEIDGRATDSCYAFIGTHQCGVDGWCWMTACYYIFHMYKLNVCGFNKRQLRLYTVTSQTEALLRGGLLLAVATAEARLMKWWSLDFMPYCYVLVSWLWWACSIMKEICCMFSVQCLHHHIMNNNTCIYLTNLW